MRTHRRAPRTHPPYAPLSWGIGAAASLVTGFVAGRAMSRRRAGDLGEIRLIAQEQSALRRVTTLVANGVSAGKIFDAVAEEMGRIVAADYMIMCRFQADETLYVVASWSARGEDWRLVPVDSVWAMFRGSVGDLVLRTGAPARRTYDAGELERRGLRSRAAREHGMRSGAGCPIMVDGRRWGVLITIAASVDSQPPGVEERMVDFLQLVAAAIANAESRAELTASRARVVAAGDASRRRIERDLHDGAQQRLVRLVLGLRGAEATVPPDQGELGKQLSEMGAELVGVLDDLREISSGLHPAVLSRGGLKPALATLARRSTIPVELDVRLDGRLEEGVEVAVYYVVSEALTNATKYARASVVRVDAHLDRQEPGAAVYVAIRDDGAGGADLGRGSGLIGLRDRVESLGGRLDISSPAGRGTSLVARIPIDTDRSSRPAHGG